jgi:hypothetical protein
MIFKIECANGDGQVFNTEIEARNEDEALAIVRKNGFFTTKIEIKPVPTVRKSSKSNVNFVAQAFSFVVVGLVVLAIVSVAERGVTVFETEPTPSTRNTGFYSGPHETYSNLTEGEVLYADEKLSNYGLDEDMQALGKFLINQDVGKNKN